MNAEAFSSLEPKGEVLKVGATRRPPRAEIDFETRSSIDLKLVGAYRYATDPSTRVLCMAYKLPNQDVKLWHPGLDLPNELFFWIEDGGLVEAHNAEFEFVIWNFVMRKEGWPRLDWSQLICSAAKSAAMGLPRALEDVCDVLDTVIKKDQDGKKIMLRLSKLKKPSKKDPDCFDDDPEKRKKLYSYCIDDVLSEQGVSEMLPDLTPRQQKFWRMTSIINERGVYCDVELSRIAYNFAKRFEIDIQRELKIISKGLVTTAKQVAKIKAYLEARGFVIENLQAKTIDAFLTSTPDLPFDVRRILEIRQAINKSSVGKFSKMLSTAGSDKRIRGTLLFHGAGTGRDAGRLIQPQNYPRGVGKKGDEILAVLALDDYEMFKERYPNVFQGLSNCLRGMLRAGPGNTLLAGDFAGIEARGVMWLAGQDDALHDYRNNVDQYIKQASNIYNKPVQEIAKDSMERFLGKQSVLGCFAKDTLVYTRTGLKKIIDVRTSDKVWDGYSWVDHGGLIYQGEKETINFLGVEATPDHLFLAGDEWQPFRGLKENLNFLRSAHEKALFLSRALITDREAALYQSKFLAFVIEQKFMKLTRTIFAFVQTVATFAQRKLQRTHENFIGVMKTLCPTLFTVKDFLTDLVPNLEGATIQRTNTLILTGEGASKFSNLGGKTAEHSYDMFKPSKVGMTQVLNWTASTTTGIMNPATFVSFLKVKMQKIKEVFWNFKKESTDSKKKTKVYDLLECGPFNRFTIHTEFGPMLVHNCGYGMGKDKFKITCAGYGVDVSIELAEKAVKTYRNTFYKVPQMWRNYETAFVNAIERPGRVFKANKCSFYVDGAWAFIVLPSGRKIAYKDPQLVTSQSPWGERKQVVYWAEDTQTKQWRPEKTYGGKITENICQAVSFDLMIEACARHEMNDFPIVMRVHDELIAEVKDEGVEKNQRNLNEFMRLMKVLPAWAEGFPIEVEGHHGPRYRK